MAVIATPEYIRARAAAVVAETARLAAKYAAAKPVASSDPDEPWREVSARRARVLRKRGNCSVRFSRTTRTGKARYKWRPVAWLLRRTAP